MSTFSAPKGTFDMLPPYSETFNRIRIQFGLELRDAGYQYIETPAFEETGLFVRGVGESTDVVTKEMYTFDDRAGRSLTLRPEGTAAVVRSVLQHNLQAQRLPVKLWYFGSFFRYEAPQAGRTRQFHQVGAESIGSADPLVDVEMIALAVEGFQKLGLKDFRLLLNSLGCKECRPVYRAKLQDFLRALDLDEDTRRRIEINPLRVLDDKRPEVQAQLTDAPLITDNLCEACAAHHTFVKSMLDDLKIAYEDSPKLVRGLDYYVRTIFEFVHDGLGAQSAIGGGGRYDGLAQELGGPELPSVGWALGIGRTMLAMEAEGQAIETPADCDVYGVALGESARREVFKLVTALRLADIPADMAFDNKKLKGSMKAADQMGARYAVIVGERDLAEGVAQLKDLTTGDQTAVALDAVVDTLKEKLQ
ncbi:histidine--tRNA ligase [Yinghuangia seranimata]|uniref:histidine--tRNA ligase n=1 Tax=Yinghuangia seranimata TaxID=408067 RepID=UPI00248C3E25|nr:histidine--tRNA ligase [Yinghuangia seranimata]MDI2132126.1 histidine--tRNA ligase [Yinghuangia seranimata]